MPITTHRGEVASKRGAGEPRFPDSTVEFRHLHYFVAVAEELHFGRAAVRAFVSQPALSQAIARLERALGVQLLVRNRQGVRLTDAGEELLYHARRLLSSRDDAVRRVRRTGQGEAGFLRAGIAMLAELDVAPALSALTAALPGITLDRVSAMSERLLAQLREGGLDLAVVHQVPLLATPGDFDWEVLRRGRLMVLLRQDHPLADRTQAKLVELREETFLVPPRKLAPSAYQGLHQMCRQVGGFRPKVIESPTASTLTIDSDWRALLDGAAIALAPEGATRPARVDGIKAVPIEPPPTFILALVWRRDDRSPLLARVVEFMRRYRDEHGWTDGPPLR